MPRSPFSTRPRRQTLVDRYLNELLSYGGELWTRADIIRDLKQSGYDDRCVDRYLQGLELRHRLEAERTRAAPQTSLIQ